jgi:hypothetical protein
MSIHCDVIVQWNATPEQLNALGAALWRWCTRAVGQAGIYQLIDSQALADLIAGRLPQPRRAEPAGVHLFVRDEISPNRRATIDSLRRELPPSGLVDILVEGASWDHAAA